MQRKNSPNSNHKATPTLTLPSRGGGRGGGETPHSYYPAFLNLQGKRVVVIGGGKVAERKVLALLESGADITVISPKITKRIAREELKDRIKYIPRQYRKGDVKNAFLAIASTDSYQINKKVSEDALCLVNVVDTPSLCNFIVPSVIQRGYLTIAISTSGASPALSKSIRKELEKLYGFEFAKYLRLLEKIRKKAMEGIQDKKQRTEFLGGLASQEMVKMLRQKGYAGVMKKITRDKVP
jgi:precorrin-2 dehydrogenase/sirohydrochlorin ferrochelatase